MKFSETQTEEAEDRILVAAVAEQSKLFNPRIERDQLSKALENCVHREYVRGMSSRMNWRDMDAWSSNVSSYRTRQRYMGRLVQQARKDTMKEMVMAKLQMYSRAVNHRWWR
jgi:hypothetical protein